MDTAKLFAMKRRPTRAVRDHTVRLSRRLRRMENQLTLRCREQKTSRVKIIQATLPFT